MRRYVHAGPCRPLPLQIPSKCLGIKHPTKLHSGFARLQVNVRAVQTWDVAIAGGGPAGLAAACALRIANPKLRVHILEKTSMRGRGAAVMVGVNGLKALEAIDPSLLDKLLLRAIKLEKSEGYHKDTGEHLYTRTIPHQQSNEKYGLSSSMLGWSDVTNALREALPKDIITTNTTISRYEQHPDGSLILYGTPAPAPTGHGTMNSESATHAGSTAGGAQPPGHTATTTSSSTSPEPALSAPASTSQEQPIGRCRMLTGADGWFSRIRQQLIGDGPPGFKGSVVWRARTKRPDWMPQRDTLWFVPSADIHPGSMLAVLIPVPGDELVWQCHYPVPLMQEAGLFFDKDKGEADSAHAEAADTSSSSSNSEHIKERCLKLFGTFPKEFSGVVADTPAAAITEHGLYQRAPEQIPVSSWGSGPVTLVGDAAHTDFVDGTGLGLSFEDAAVLGAVVKELGIGEEAARAYEAARGQRVRAIFEMQVRHTQAAAAREGDPKERLAERDALLNGEAKFQPLWQQEEQVVPALEAM